MNGKLAYAHLTRAMEKRKEFVPQTQDLESKVKAQVIGLVDKSKYHKIKEESDKSLVVQFKQPPPLKSTKKSDQKRLSFFDEEDAGDVILSKKKSTFVQKSTPEIQELGLESSIELKYSYWDTHAFKTVLLDPKSSVEQFIDSVRKEFPSLKGVSMDNILCVKDDLILPHVSRLFDFQHLSFQSLRKIEGKYGLLFDESKSFQILGPSEKNRLVRIAERSWFERHKHLHPANKWKPLDINKVALL